jgi:hypothetical protein
MNSVGKGGQWLSSQKCSWSPSNMQKITQTITIIWIQNLSAIFQTTISISCYAVPIHFTILEHSPILDVTIRFWKNQDFITLTKQSKFIRIQDLTQIEISITWEVTFSFTEIRNKCSMTGDLLVIHQCQQIPLSELSTDRVELSEVTMLMAMWKRNMIDGMTIYRPFWMLDRISLISVSLNRIHILQSNCQTFFITEEPFLLGPRWWRRCTSWTLEAKRISGVPLIHEYLGPAMDTDSLLSIDLEKKLDGFRWLKLIVP